MNQNLNSFNNQGSGINNLIAESILLNDNPLTPDNLSNYINWEYFENPSTGVGTWLNKGIIKFKSKKFNIFLDFEGYKALSPKNNSFSSLKFWEKRLWLNLYINQNVYNKSDEYFTLVIDRTNILQESLNQFHTTKDLDLKKAVQIHFIGEVAQDVGGVFRDWYSSIFNEIFNFSKYNLFYEINNKFGNSSIFIPTTKIKNMEFINNNDSIIYKFIGQIFAKGIYDKSLLKLNLNRVLLKHLQRETIVLDDIKYFDYEVRFQL